MGGFYLDSCILVSCFLKDNYYNEISKCLKKMSSSSLWLIISNWTIAETVKVLIRKKKCDPKEVYEFIYEITTKKRLDENKIKMIDASTRKDYDIDELFIDLSKSLVKFGGDIADTLHCLIMQNNKLKNMLTTDDTFDSGSPEIILFKPKDILRILGQK